MLSSARRLYLDWLFALVESARPGQTFLCLFRELYRTKFQADVRIPLDANRVSYALGLREEFFRTCNIPYEDDFDEERISMLELLMQLAYDMGEITSREDNIPSYFFSLLENMGICIPDSEYIDVDRLDAAVHLTLQKVIKRKYGPRGLLFPLRHPAMDQRRVELWYQMNAYLIEQEEHWTS